MGVASLIFGIVSLSLLYIEGPFAIVGFTIGLIGVILGALGRKESKEKGLATAGLVCSLVGVVLNGIMIASIILYQACWGRRLALRSLEFEE